ncbi:MAG: hypothetical protein J6O90_06320, partial [Candidatus Methanomethylophilaceae archaeon]|nr:hypothetical protein [Candidatus Methanomethylophilaceae archaeon]
GWGIFVFIGILLAGILFLAVSIISVASGKSVGERRMLPRTGLHKWTVIILMLMLCAGLPVMIYDLTDHSSSVDVELEEDCVHVKAPLSIDWRLAYSDIDNVEYRPNLDRGERVAGYGGVSLESGTFRNSEFGSYQLASYIKCSPCIVVTMDNGKVYAFNQSDADSTYALYGNLLTKL